MANIDKNEPQLKFNDIIQKVIKKNILSHLISISYSQINDDMVFFNEDFKITWEKTYSSYILLNLALVSLCS